MKIYLDICCFNRPFDDQTQLVVHLEAQAKLYIQEQIIYGVYDLAWSYTLDYELSKNPYEEYRQAIAPWHEIAVTNILKANDDILAYAEELGKKGVKKFDALHVACAVEAGCDYFITTDKKILNKQIDRIHVVNPIDFIREQEASDED